MIRRWEPKLPLDWPVQTCWMHETIEFRDIRPIEDGTDGLADASTLEEFLAAMRMAGRTARMVIVTINMFYGRSDATCCPCPDRTTRRDIRNGETCNAYIPDGAVAS